MMRKLHAGQYLAILTSVTAALAAGLGFVPGVYRDSASLIAQSHGQDLATLFLGVPVLATALVVRARLPARAADRRGALGYLLYTYVTFSFDAVLNPATVPGTYRLTALWRAEPSNFAVFAQFEFAVRDYLGRRLEKLDASTL